MTKPTFVAGAVMSPSMNVDGVSLRFVRSADKKELVHAVSDTLEASIHLDIGKGTILGPNYVHADIVCMMPSLDGIWETSPPSVMVVSLDNVYAVAQGAIWKIVGLHRTGPHPSPSVDFCFQKMQYHTGLNVTQMSHVVFLDNDGVATIPLPI